MAELITVAKYWRDWADHRFIICVFNNEDLNQVTWKQRVMEGDPKFEASQNIPDVSYHRFAKLMGLTGLFVDRPKNLGPGWDEALASDVPFCLKSRGIPKSADAPASDIRAGQESDDDAGEWRSQRGGRHSRHGAAGFEFGPSAETRMIRRHRAEGWRAGRTGRTWSAGRVEQLFPVLVVTKSRRFVPAIDLIRRRT